MRAIMGMRAIEGISTGRMERYMTRRKDGGRSGCFYVNDVVAGWTGVVVLGVRKEERE